MRAGKRDRIIKVYKPCEQTKSTFGETETSYELMYEPYAEVTDARGNERWVAAQFLAEADKVFNIIWRAGITPKHYIKYECQDYDILGTVEIGRREGLAISAKLRAVV